VEFVRHYHSPDARGGRRRDPHEGHGRGRDANDAYDIVTPTERERLERRIARRRRRYFAVMVPCLLLVAFGFFVPAPTPLRLVALAFAAWMPPVAAILGNADGPDGGPDPK
jgi:Protein of unknown function (DUF3099)